jgi:hypothetical protein
METDLVALLQAITPHVYPDVAPAGTATPYAVWQAIGGEALRYGDGTAPDKRNTYLQVAIWSATRAEALALIHQIEATLCAAPVFAAIEPQGEAVSTWEPATQRYGSIQRFDIWADR